MDRRIRIVEGSTRPFTFTFKQAGSIFSLLGWTGKIYVKDKEAAKGTNVINGDSITLVGDGSGGQATYVFDAAETDHDGTTFKGTLGFRLTDGTEIVWIVVDDIYFTTNPFIP